MIAVFHFYSIMFCLLIFSNKFRMQTKTHQLNSHHKESWWTTILHAFELSTDEYKGFKRHWTRWFVSICHFNDSHFGGRKIDGQIKFTSWWRFLLLLSKTIKKTFRTHHYSKCFSRSMCTIKSDWIFHSKTNDIHSTVLHWNSSGKYFSDVPFAKLTSRKNAAKWNSIYSRQTIPNL